MKELYTYDGSTLFLPYNEANLLIENNKTILLFEVKDVEVDTVFSSIIKKEPSFFKSSS